MKIKYNRFLPLAAVAILTTTGHVLAQTSFTDGAWTSNATTGNLTINPSTEGATTDGSDASLTGSPDVPVDIDVLEVLGSSNLSQNSTTSGKAEIKTNGDITLSQGTSNSTVGTFYRLKTVESTGNSTTTKFFMASKDLSGNFTVLPGTGAFNNESALDTAIAAYNDSSNSTFAGVVTTNSTKSGGNLTVGGSTSTNGINNNGLKITGLGAGTDVTDAANVGQVADVQDNLDAEVINRGLADADLQDNIDAEATARADADADLQDNIDAEATRATAAEGVLDGKITQEVADRTALIRNVGGKIHIGQNSLVTSEAGGFQELSAQTVGGGSIDINVTNGSDLRVNGVSVATDADVANEASARTIADSLIRTDFAAADTAERNARIAADNSIRSDFAAADDSIRDEFQTADRNLRNDIDTNTRGIAMVAAMTNTTIRDGMTQGVDFNISQFEGETGFAFGYARKINENVQLHGAAASTTDFEESVGRLGVSFQW